MPIPIQCQCGKSLKVKDELAGKAVKCPGCGNPVRVGKAPAAKPARAPAPAVAPAANDGLDDLFDEAGFSQNVEAVCPSCRVEMPAHAVMCVKCGFNKETGESIERHKTMGLDIDMGEAALMKAESDLAHADRVQKEMLARAGMPWWMLALVLFGIVSGMTLAVIAVMQSRQVEGNAAFNAKKTFFALMAGAVGVVAAGMAGNLAFRHWVKKNTDKKFITKISIAIGVLIAIMIGLIVAGVQA